MGNTQKNINNNLQYLHHHKRNYQLIDKSLYTVWKRKQDGLQLFQEYTIYIPNEQILESYKLMCNLRTNHQHLINVHYFTYFQHDQICGNIKKGIIMTEIIPKTLSQIKLIPYSQSLALLNQLIQKFQILYLSYGPFKPTSSMIGFQNNNQKFRIKIWHNSNFSQLIPQFPNFISKSHMINSLVKCIENHGIKPNHQLFSQFLNQVNNNQFFHGFQQLKLGLYRYCRKYKIDIFSQDFSYLKQKIGLSQKDKTFNYQRIFQTQLQNHTKVLKDKYMNGKNDNINDQYYKVNKFEQNKQNVLKPIIKRVRFTYQSTALSNKDNSFISHTYNIYDDISKISKNKAINKSLLQGQSTMFNSSFNQTNSNNGFKNSNSSFNSLYKNKKSQCDNQDLSNLKKTPSLKHQLNNQYTNKQKQSSPNISRFSLINNEDKQNKLLINPFKEHELDDIDENLIKKCQSTIYMKKKQSKKEQNGNNKQQINENKPIKINIDSVQQYYPSDNKKDFKIQKQLSSDTTVVPSISFNKRRKSCRKPAKSLR